MLCYVQIKHLQKDMHHLFFYQFGQKTTKRHMNSEYREKRYTDIALEIENLNSG